MKEFLELFLTFAKVGVMTFGGGMAMLPILQREVVENKGWATDEELTDYFAIGQCTPGVIAVNTATFIGCKEKGSLGAAIATLGVICPSIIIILIIAAILTNFASLPAVGYAFNGIRVAVAVLILNAVIKLIRSNLKQPVSILICVLAFAVSLFSLSPVIIVLSAGAVGIAYGYFGRQK